MPPIPPKHVPTKPTAPPFNEPAVAGAAETAIAATRGAAVDVAGQLAALQRLQRYIAEEVQTSAAEAMAARGARARAARAELAAQPEAK